MEHILHCLIPATDGCANLISLTLVWALNTGVVSPALTLSDWRRRRSSHRSRRTENWGRRKLRLLLRKETRTIPDPPAKMTSPVSIFTFSPQWRKRANLFKLSRFHHDQDFLLENYIWNLKQKKGGITESFSDIDLSLVSGKLTEIKFR